MVSRFSILTPSLNQGRFIRANIESVLAQDDPTCEHIIMDGGSTDETLSILQAYSHLRWQSEPDRGQSHALNKALALATGDIVGWINSDDAFAPGAFDTVREAFAAHPEAAVVFGDCYAMDEAGTLGEIQRTYENGVHSLITFWRGGYRIWQPSVFWKRSLHEAIGSFDESLHLAMDWEFFIRARARSPFVHIDRPLACFRQHANAKTADETAGWYECLPQIPRLLKHLPESEHAGVLASMQRFITWMADHGYPAPPPIPGLAD